METAARRLPPLAALRAFEAAARHLSFKRAARELLVTPTAISHQVRLLEEALGVRLFERRTRQVVMTAEAQALYPVLRDGFDAFARAIDAIERLSRRPGRAAVTLSATRAFTAKWLVPRVAGFQRAHPDIDVRLLATDEVVDLAAGSADLAIRYGRGPYPGLAAEPLLADRFAPVAHPSLGLRAPADLAKKTLVHFEWSKADPENPTWPRWYRAAGLAAGDAPAGLSFTDESHAIQATLAGHGVGLLSLTLLDAELADGTLVQPFGPVMNGMTYWVARAADRPMTEAVAALDAWLRAESAAASAARQARGRAASASHVAPGRHGLRAEGAEGAEGYRGGRRGKRQ